MKLYPDKRPFVGQRVAYIDQPDLLGTVQRVRRAARRNYYNVDVLVDEPPADGGPRLVCSVSGCWLFFWEGKR